MPKRNRPKPKSPKAEKTHECSETGCNKFEAGRTIPSIATNQCDSCKLWFCENHLEEHECNATEQFETAFSARELAD